MTLKNNINIINIDDIENLFKDRGKEKVHINGQFSICLELV